MNFFKRIGLHHFLAVRMDKYTHPFNLMESFFLFNKNQVHPLTTYGIFRALSYHRRQSAGVFVGSAVLLLKFEMESYLNEPEFYPPVLFIDHGIFHFRGFFDHD